MRERDSALGAQLIASKTPQRVDVSALAQENLMITRFFRAIVHDNQQGAFKEFFLETALPLVRSQKGIVSVSVGLPHEATPNEFSMLMVWRDLEALKGFAGETWTEAVVHPHEAHMLKKVHVHHYYTVDG